MKIRILPIVSALAVSAFAGNAMAYDVRLEINGTLTSSTCQIDSSNGQLTKTVTLPTLSTSALFDAGSAAGRRPISLAISGCNAETNVVVNFEPGPNISSTGTLINGAPEALAAGNVEVQLLDGNAEVLNLRDDTPSFPISGGTGTIDLFAQYYSPAGGATAGDVSTSVEMSMYYN